MATLKGEVKAFIVQSLACFDTPSQVVELVKKEFGLSITRQQVESHDPTKANGRGLAQKWVELFNDTRKRFQTELSDIPIANKAYRLRALDRMMTKAEGMRNMALAATLMEQAAKEVGDAYTNKQKVEQIVVATHNVMPVPSCDNVDDWEKAAQKQQGEVLGG
ncbi:DUF2280 domain-containing protein [Enterobacter cloacae]|jgi:hypothetical protein|uniref:DUF2280 domain-containing protein n=1 Tax=Enterobacter cloacae TaxID=550 RepID=A0A6S5JN32_ENTCL|nr:DUF2280 domain-containing protein [Enterobacter cloacae]MCI1898530.1 DUF2280 domain-containing protein [Enterobacter sp.]BBS32463.1 hypothetical protein WP5S18C02_26690 [Enterobacter cloacae]